MRWGGGLHVPGGVGLALTLAGCSPAVTAVPPSAARPVPVAAATSLPSIPVPVRVAPPAAAFASGWMPLESTGAASFVRQHPTYDGRGVLVGILDSGIDPGVPGLETTTTGQRKLLDLRDFSAEGRVQLLPAAPRGDTIMVGSRPLRGFGRIIALSTNAQYYAGTIAELPLGTPAVLDPDSRPPSDVNDNGSFTDTLGIVVTRATSGWVLFADTDGDGSLDDERPVHDYLVAFETFGWHGEGRDPSITMAANFQEIDGEPVLDLVFDNSGHGTHVAGIAAGHAMYGVSGFNGVAPGAQLLGLKIANNAQGGISVTGSMQRAIAYAITFAEARRLPLVLNLSFGVGNEREGDAVIDHVIDSILGAHPDVVFTVSAGNDGPGISTVGFPGSSRRTIAVGGSFPLVFVQARGQQSTPDPVAFFSSRGGELAKPDLIAPGVAYSTVPPWNAGHERNLGTSMAAPHAAGLAALLVSAQVQDEHPYTAERIKRALTVTARPVPGSSVIDDGAGVPDVGQAYRWLDQVRDVFEVTVEALREDGTSGQAAFRARGLESNADTIQLFRVTPGSPVTPGPLALESDAAWLEAPPTVTLADSSVTIPLIYRAIHLGTPGVYTGVVSGWSEDRLDGPLVRLVNTIVVPYAAGENVRVGPATVAQGRLHRVFFGAEQDRPFTVTVRTAEPGPLVLTSLHEPGGQPYRGGNGRPGGPGPQAASYAVKANEVIPGVHEIDVIAPLITSARAVVDVSHAPVRFDVFRDARGVRTTLDNAVGGTVTGTVMTSVIGAQRRLVLEGRGSDPQWVLFRVPAWAEDIEVDVEMKADEWPTFTDFGVTLFDSIGRIITLAPLNYARERLSASFEPASGEQAVKLGLFPGFATPGSDAPWSLGVEIRFYADPSRATTHATTPVSFSLEPGETKELVSLLDPEPSLVPGIGFEPLVRVMVDAGGQTWVGETTPTIEKDD